MFMTKEKLSVLIKMERLIGANETALFGETKSETNNGVTHDDFISFVNIIEDVIQNHEKINERNKQHKPTKEYNNATVNMCNAKKRGNIDLYNYWKQKRDQLKSK